MIGDLYHELQRRNADDPQKSLAVLVQPAWQVKPGRNRPIMLLQENDVELAFPERLTWKFLIKEARTNLPLFRSAFLPGEVPPPVKTDADRQAEFARICRENNLSECAANQQLHREGAALENFAGASQVELQKFHAEAAQTRQKFLINSATPSELRAESRYQSATEREIAIKAEADRQHQFVSQQQQQSGIYPPLPATMPDTGEIIDSRFIKRLSTLDYVRFRAMVKRYGTAQITKVLRTPAAPTV